MEGSSGSLFTKGSRFTPPLTFHPGPLLWSLFPGNQVLPPDFLPQELGPHVQTQGRGPPPSTPTGPVTRSRLARPYWYRRGPGDDTTPGGPGSEGDKVTRVVEDDTTVQDSVQEREKSVTGRG